MEPCQLSKFSGLIVMNDVKCVVIEPNNEVDKVLHEQFTSGPQKWIEFGEHKTFLPAKYVKIMDDIDNFEVRNDDVFVVAHPRSGIVI